MVRTSQYVCSRGKREVLWQYVVVVFERLGHVRLRLRDLSLRQHAEPESLMLSSCMIKSGPFCRATWKEKSMSVISRCLMVLPQVKELNLGLTREDRRGGATHAWWHTILAQES